MQLGMFLERHLAFAVPLLILYMQYTVDFAGRNYTLQLDSDAAFTEFTTEFAKQVDAAMFTKVKSGKPLRVSCLAFRDGGVRS
jgi:hypothetical protein